MEEEGRVRGGVRLLVGNRANQGVCAGAGISQLSIVEFQESCHGNIGRGMFLASRGPGQKKSHGEF